MYTPQNTAWTPTNTPSAVHASNRVSGYNPLNNPHEAHGRKLASFLSTRGWGEGHALRADPVDRRRHMQMAGVSNETIESYGDDVWNYAIHTLKQRELHTEKFDNDFHD